MPVKYKLGTGDTVDLTAITKTNQGAGSGLDSDQVDGLHAVAFELIANKGVASGYAGLNASSLVVQNPASKGQANGLAELDSGGKVPSAQLPALALTDVWTVASETAQLALVAEEGDIAIRTDLNKSYAHNGGTAGTMADWSLLLTPTDAVLSVNGETGAVILTTGDIAEDTNKKYVTDAEKAALAGTNGTPSGINKYLTDSDPRNSNFRPFNPELWVELYEDFLQFSNAAAATGTTTICDYSWKRYGAAQTTSATGGVVDVDGDGTTQGHLLQMAQDGYTNPWQASKNPEIRLRWAQSGTGAGTRRIGLGNSSGIDPTDGIYFRHTVGGNIIAVCRSGDVETTLDTAVAAADGAYHTARLVVTGGGTNVEVFIDEVSKGNITTNIPGSNLPFVASSGGTAANTGLKVDYIYVRQSR